jgi:hypothetical protein
MRENRQPPQHRSHCGSLALCRPVDMGFSYAALRKVVAATAIQRLQRQLVPSQCGCQFQAQLKKNSFDFKSQITDDEAKSEVAGRKIGKRCGTRKARTGF